MTSIYNKRGILILRYIFILVLVLYVFLSDIISAFGGPYFKMIIALSVFSLSTFFIPFYYIKAKNYERRLVIFSVVLVPVFLLFWKGEYNEINLFLSVFIGLIFFYERKILLKYLIILFVLQILLVTIERFTETYFFDSSLTGLFKTTARDLMGKAMENKDVVGFRPKGLFIGTLVASSFVIYLSFLFKDNLRVLILILIMSLLLNGRLSFLVAFIFFLSAFRRNIRFSFKGRFLSKKATVVIISGLGVVFIGVSFLFLSEVVVNNFLNIFDFDSVANAGRINRATSGIKVYFSDHSLVEKIFGSTDYELLDKWDRPMPAESEWVNLLLKTGIVGTFFYLYVFVLLFKKARIFDKIRVRKYEIKYIYIILLMFFCMIVYRHIAGWARGGLFWMFVFYSFNELNNYIYEHEISEQSN